MAITIVIVIFAVQEGREEKRRRAKVHNITYYWNGECVDAIACRLIRHRALPIPIIR